MLSFYGGHQFAGIWVWFAYKCAQSSCLQHESTQLAASLGLSSGKSNPIESDKPQERRKDRRHAQQIVLKLVVIFDSVVVVVGGGRGAFGAV